MTREVLAFSLSLALLACDEPARTEPAPKAQPSAAASAAPSARAQTPAASVVSADPPAPPAPTFGKEDRAQLAEQVAKDLEDQYAAVDVGGKMAAALRKKASGGGYDAVASPVDFAQAVTADLRAAGQDPRVTLEFDPSGRGSQDAERAAHDKKNAGFGVGGRLPGNVARVVIDSFEPREEVREAVETHMAEAADADALLLDLRENAGGDPATVGLVASYLLDGSHVHLDDTWWRSTGSTEAVFTEAVPATKRFGGQKPVVILTSGKTTGAGEELAYDLQALHRAVVVGEKTAGIARPVAVSTVGTSFTLRVPVGRVVNAVTKKDWEGVGVVPDAATTAGAALKEGYLRAVKAVIASPGLPAAKKKGLTLALKGMEP